MMITKLFKNVFVPFLARIQALEYSLGLIADYVVETGIDGNWAYTKWESGKLEAYCIDTSAETNFTSYNNFKVYHKNIATPSVCLTEPVLLSYVVKVGLGYSIPALAHYTTNNFDCYALSDQTGSQTYIVTLNILSSWK